VILVKGKDACRKASLIARIAIDHNRFVFWDFIKMAGQFPDVDVVGARDMADSMPVFYIPYIEDEGVFFIKTLL
jgi:hypothetical protein